MTERSGALQEDPLYMSYAEIIAKSCGEEEEEGGDEEEEGGGGGGEGDEGNTSIHRTSLHKLMVSYQGMVRPTTLFNS
ncbi:ryanodine receptor-like [Diaphorina citri]|uniref:Ryanodine receptor-like n=1 Tax=Diaphorina citri TaxID=121845 RepID=A0A3Q0JJD1_DIACI|nr:ryanodine receptor-like [Diaphorina citri]